MESGLIGHTGFVGSNLLQQKSFDGLYNSKNITELKGKDFDLLVCAGVRAEKWLANKHPEDDLKGINHLLYSLQSVRTRKFVLISTIDVYRTPLKVDEDTPIEPDQNDPYGRHRYIVENFVRDRFSDHCIIRLPGIIGRGLKKNFIYDLLHPVPKFIFHGKFQEILALLKDAGDRNMLMSSYAPNMNQIYVLSDSVDSSKLSVIRSILQSVQFDSLIFTHKDSSFQFYYLERLWHDIQLSLLHSLRLVNMATEPVVTADIAHRFFGIDFKTITDKPPVHYDMKSKYASVYGGGNGYLYRKEQVYKQIEEFIKLAKKEQV